MGSDGMFIPGERSGDTLTQSGQMSAITIGVSTFVRLLVTNF
jgi:hypothetical protein